MEIAVSASVAPRMSDGRQRVPVEEIPQDLIGREIPRCFAEEQCEQRGTARPSVTTTLHLDQADFGLVTAWPVERLLRGGAVPGGIGKQCDRGSLRVTAIIVAPRRDGGRDTQELQKWRRSGGGTVRRNDRIGCPVNVQDRHGSLRPLAEGHHRSGHRPDGRVSARPFDREFIAHHPAI